jgi:predicted DNA-binding protein
MGRKSHPADLAKPTSIRLPAALLSSLEEAASALGLSSTDVMRLALEVGLKHLNHIDHDLAESVITTSLHRLKPKPQATADEAPPTAGSAAASIAKLSAKARAAHAASKTPTRTPKQQIG